VSGKKLHMTMYNQQLVLSSVGYPERDNMSLNMLLYSQTILQSHQERNSTAKYGRVYSKHIAFS
jgi:hypothetical protein